MKKILVKREQIGLEGAVNKLFEEIFEVKKECFKPLSLSEKSSEENKCDSYF